MKKEVAARGVDLISLGIGDPDSPTLPTHRRAPAEAATRPANHRYPDYEGMPSFRAAAAAFSSSASASRVDPATEVVSLIGSKEGIANMAVAFVDPGDIVLVPDPGYPVYGIGTQFNGGTIYPMPLRAENGFLPDLQAIPEEIAKRAKLMWIGYPNNPTGALATRQFFADVVASPSATASSSPTTTPTPRSTSTSRRRASSRPPGRRARHRVPLALEDLQHDGLARRVRRRQPRADRRARQGQDQRRFRDLPGGAGGRHRRPLGRPVAGRRHARALSPAPRHVPARARQTSASRRSRCAALLRLGDACRAVHATSRHREAPARHRRRRHPGQRLRQRRRRLHPLQPPSPRRGSRSHRTPARL